MHWPHTSCLTSFPLAAFNNQWSWTRFYLLPSNNTYSILYIHGQIKQKKQKQIISSHLTWRPGAVRIFYGQFELLNEVGSVETPLLPDVQQSLHVLFTALICFTAGRQGNSRRKREDSLNRYKTKQKQCLANYPNTLYIIKKTVFFPDQLLELWDQIFNIYH